MKILSTYENAMPISQADAEVVVNTAAALARRGHDVTLISPVNPAKRASIEEIRTYYGVEGPLKMVLHEPPLWSRGLASLTHRAPHRDPERGRQHLTQILALPRHPAAKAAEVIYTRHIPMALHALSVGRRVFFDHYRPWGDQVPPMQPMIRAMVGHPGFVGMVTHSAVAARAYKRLGVPEAMVEVRHNGYDPARMQPVLSKAAAREKTGLPQDRPVVVYTGRINEKKGLEVVLEMAKALPRTVFVLVGSEGRGSIEQAAESIENVVIVPWQPFSETAAYLYAADALMIPPSSAPMQRFGSTVLPLKVYLYLGAGRPIFAGATADIEEVLVHDENACLVPPGDFAAAKDALAQLVDDSDRLRRLGEGASATAAGLTWDARAEKIERFMETRLASPHEAIGKNWSKQKWLGESGRWLRTGLTEGRWIQGGSQ